MVKNNTVDTTDLASALMERSGIREKDIRVIRMYAEGKCDGDDAFLFFSSLNPEEEPYYFNYVLSRTGAAFGWDVIPEGIRPVIEGVHRKNALKNMEKMAGALKLMRKLGEKDVPLLVIKGGALKFSLLPDVVRMMSDIDIVVPEDRYRECVDIATGEGFETSAHAMHSADIYKDGKTCADIHYRVFKSNVQKDEPFDMILRNSSVVEKSGAAFYVPSPEDAMLIIMVNAVGNILTGSRQGPVTWLADCLDLMRRYSPDPDVVAGHARDYGVYPEFCAAVCLMEKILPGVFTEFRSRADEKTEKRTASRMLAVMNIKRLSKDEIKKLPVFKRMIYMTRVSFKEYTGLYHTGDSFYEIITDIPDMVKKWTRAERLSDVPGECIRIARKWKNQQKEI